MFHVPRINNLAYGSPYILLVTMLTRYIYYIHAVYMHGYIFNANNHIDGFGSGNENDLGGRNCYKNIKLELRNG